MYSWRSALTILACVCLLIFPERTVKQAVEHGHLRADTDPEQMVFEIFSLLTGFLYDAHVKRDPKCFGRVTLAYERLLSTYRAFGGSLGPGPGPTGPKP